MCKASTLLSATAHSYTFFSPSNRLSSRSRRNKREGVFICHHPEAGAKEPVGELSMSITTLEGQLKVVCERFPRGKDAGTSGEKKKKIIVLTLAMFIEADGNTKIYKEGQA